MTVLIGDATLIGPNHIAGKELNSTIYRTFLSVVMRIKSQYGVSMRVFLVVHSEWQLHVLINSHTNFWRINLCLIWQPQKNQHCKWFTVGLSLISCDTIIIQISKVKLFLWKQFNSICLVIKSKTTIYFRLCK